MAFEGEPRPSVEELRREYESGGDVPIVLSRGRGHEADRKRADDVWAKLNEKERGILVKANVIALRHGVSLDALAYSCHAFVKWSLNSLAEHAATCKDKECGCKAVLDGFYAEYHKLLAESQGKRKRGE
jgi:hypothetical protein